MAGRIALDLKQFKHVSSDKDSTTLQHADGHELRIAHGPLSKEAKEQLGALAKAEPKKEERPLRMKDAGGVPMRSEISSDDPRLLPEDAQPISSEPLAAPVAQEDPQIDIDPALARKREMYNALKGSGPGPQQPGFEQFTFGPDGQEPTSFDPTAWAKTEQTYAQEQAKNAAEVAGQQQQAVATNQARTAAGMQPIPVPNIPQGPQLPQVGGPAIQKAADVGGALTSVEQASAQPQDMMSAGYENQMAGIKQEEAAQMQLANKQQTILADQITAQKDAMDAYKTNYDALERERQAHIADIQNSHIDPNQYWTGDKNGNGSHSRIASAIGMIIAGFNPTSRPNAAIEFLENQMAANIKAQEQNLNSKQNLLQANLRQFGNMKDAADMTRLMQADMVKNQLLDASAKAGTPMAKAAALKAAGDLQMKYAPLQQQMAGNLAFRQLMSAGQKDPSKIPAALTALQSVDPKKAEDLRERWIPGTVAFANSTDDKKYLTQVVDRSKMIKTNVDKAISMIKAKGTYEALGPHNAVLNGLVEQIATDQAKLLDPNSIARPSEVESVKKNLIEAGLSTSNKTAQEQLKAFMRTVDDRTAQAFRNRGIDIPGSSSQQAPASKFNFKKTGK
jgi:hypothetical protein